MINTPKRQQIGLNPESKAEVLKRSAVILWEIIWRAVKGETTPWPIDLTFKRDSSFQDRFNEGKDDQQIILWAIWESAQRNEPVPPWVADALKKYLFRAAKGDLATWDDAFGKIIAKGHYRTKIQTLSHMVEVWEHIKEFGGKIDKNLFKLVGEELNIGKETTVQKLYVKAKKYFESEDGKEVMRKSLTA
jgi:hypothetical protein